MKKSITLCSSRSQVHLSLSLSLSLSGQISAGQNMGVSTSAQGEKWIPVKPHANRFEPISESLVEPSDNLRVEAVNTVDSGDSDVVQLISGENPERSLVGFSFSGDPRFFSAGSSGGTPRQNKPAFSAAVPENQEQTCVIDNGNAEQDCLQPADTPPVPVQQDTPTDLEDLGEPCDSLVHRANMVEFNPTVPMLKAIAKPVRPPDDSSVSQGNPTCPLTLPTLTQATSLSKPNQNQPNQSLTHLDSSPDPPSTLSHILPFSQTIPKSNHSHVSFETEPNYALTHPFLDDPFDTQTQSPNQTPGSLNQNSSPPSTQLLTQAHSPTNHVLTPSHVGSSDMSSEDLDFSFPPGFTPDKEDMTALRGIMKEGVGLVPPEYQDDFVKSVDLAEDGEILEFFQEKFKENTPFKRDTNYLTFRDVRCSPQLRKRPAKLSNSASLSGLKKGFLK